MKFKIPTNFGVFNQNSLALSMKSPSQYMGSHHKDGDDITDSSFEKVY